MRPQEVAQGLPDPFARHLAAAFDSLSEGILITGMPGFPARYPPHLALKTQLSLALDAAVMHITQMCLHIASMRGSFAWLPCSFGQR